MIGTEGRTVVGNEPRSRRSDEIRLLEQMWATPSPGSEQARFSTHPRTWLFPVALAVGWLAFLTVLFATAPPSDGAATPVWAEQVAGFMFLALLAAPLGFLYKFAGFGASGVAALCGTALGVGCFAGGHTGAWPMFQVAGFVALGVASAVGVGRSISSR